MSFTDDLNQTVNTSSGLFPISWLFSYVLSELSELGSASGCLFPFRLLRSAFCCPTCVYHPPLQLFWQIFSASWCGLYILESFIFFRWHFCIYFWLFECVERQETWGERAKERGLTWNKGRIQPWTLRLCTVCMYGGMCLNHQDTRVPLVYTFYVVFLSQSNVFCFAFLGLQKLTSLTRKNDSNYKPAIRCVCSWHLTFCVRIKGLMHFNLMQLQ